MKLGPDDQIDLDGPVTPYRQLAGIIRARIDRGDWQPGRPIPSEVRLVQEYGVSRGTVRRAIAVLVEDGAVFVVPQRGMYVSDNLPPAKPDPAPRTARRRKRDS